MSYNIVRPSEPAQSALSQDILSQVNRYLSTDGWALLRGFTMDMSIFSDLIASLCKTITFDPARQNSDKNTQKVDAGLGPIGLHIENGNTPICPDIVAFYSAMAAFEGSQTTVCDGQKIFESFTESQKSRYTQSMTVTRTLPEALWKRYLANEHPAIDEPEQVTMEHVLQFKAAIPNQDFTLNEDGSLEYRMTLPPVRSSVLADGHGFANAILGPSHNYEKPVYQFEDGSFISDEEIAQLKIIAEQHTVEINWQDGDVAIIDNTRVMHGRRAIKDPQRQLYIGMGRLS